MLSFPCSQSECDKTFPQREQKYGTAARPTCYGSSVDEKPIKLRPWWAFSFPVMASLALTPAVKADDGSTSQRMSGSCGQCSADSSLSGGIRREGAGPVSPTGLMRPVSARGRIKPVLATKAAKGRSGDRRPRARFQSRTGSDGNLVGTSVRIGGKPRFKSQQSLFYGGCCAVFLSRCPRTVWRGFRLGR